jgi:hypothetical protein
MIAGELYPLLPNTSAIFGMVFQSHIYHLISCIDVMSCVAGRVTFVLLSNF